MQFATIKLGMSELWELGKAPNYKKQESHSAIALCVDPYASFKKFHQQKQF